VTGQVSPMYLEKFLEKTAKHTQDGWRPIMNRVPRRNRTILAFATSPAVGALIFAQSVGFIDGTIARPRLLVSSSVLAYLATLVLGVPIYLLTRRYGYRSKAYYAMVAVSTACLPTAVVGVLSRSLLLSMIAVIGAVVAGLNFWAIAEARSDDSIPRGGESGGSRR